MCFEIQLNHLITISVPTRCCYLFQEQIRQLSLSVLTQLFYLEDLCVFV